MGRARAPTGTASSRERSPRSENSTFPAAQNSRITLLGPRPSARLVSSGSAACGIGPATITLETMRATPYPRRLRMRGGHIRCRRSPPAPSSRPCATSTRSGLPLKAHRRQSGGRGRRCSTCAPAAAESPAPCTMLSLLRSFGTRPHHPHATRVVELRSPAPSQKRPAKLFSSGSTHRPRSVAPSRIASPSTTICTRSRRVSLSSVCGRNACHRSRCTEPKVEVDSAAPALAKAVSPPHRVPRPATRRQIRLGASAAGAVAPSWNLRRLRTETGHAPSNATAPRRKRVLRLDDMRALSQRDRRRLQPGSAVWRK
jgi:hypothetical protein